MSGNQLVRLPAPAAVRRRIWWLTGLFVLCVLVIGAVARFGLSGWAASFPTGATVAIAVAIASTIAYGAPTLLASVRDRLTRVRRANTALAEHFVSWGADGGPRIADVNDPNELGVTPAAELPGVAAPADRPPAYLPRTRDDEIRELLRTSNFVLIQGPAKAGKSRSAYEAIRAQFPDRLLLAPKADARFAVRELDDVLRTFELALPDSVLWLDGLNRHLGRDGLTTERLRRLADSRHGQLTIVATMRLELLDEFPTETDTGKLGSVVLSKARTVRLDKHLDSAERTRARRRIAPADPRIAAALASPVGLAECLAAVPELRRRLAADGEKNPAGVAIVRAAIDCRRAGVRQPVPEAILRRLQPSYGGHPADFADGLAWAVARVCATVALLSRKQDGYSPFDQLVEDADNRGQPVPRATWQVLLDELAEPAELFEIGRRAYRTGQRPIAEIAFGRAARAGDAAGMNGLGVLRHAQGDEQAAEAWYRTAADAGNMHATRNLGMIMMDRGDTAEAERLYRKAADAGNGMAMNSLGVVLEGRREVAEAETWYRKAADAGNTVAMNNLGILLELGGLELGRREDADRWRHLASDTDATAGATDEDNARSLPGGREWLGEAADWYRAAADAGNSAARAVLATMDIPHGAANGPANGRATQPDGPDRAATEAVYAAAMGDLGDLLVTRNRPDEAIAAYWHAAAAGHTGVIRRLDALRRSADPD